MTSTSDTATVILKQDRLGRVRTPREKRERILEEFERSGMSGQQFAAHVGVKYPTFATWAQAKRREKARGAQLGEQGVAMRWVEAQLDETQDRRAKPSGLLVELPGGARMAVSDERAAVLAAVVLGHLGSGRC
jgi:transposase-like protein